MELTQKKQVLILGVIYKSWMDTIRFVDSIKRCFENDVKVILVDNSETSPGSSFMEKIGGFDFITYIKSEKNQGYFQGARSGLTYYLKDNPVLPQWIIVCNVDIVFETPELMNRLDSLENITNPGVIAPAIVSNKWKTDYNPFRMSRIPLKKLFYYRVIYSNILFHNGYILIHYIKRIMKLMWQKIGVNRKSDLKPPMNIYAPHGSCIIFHKNYFERGGTLDHASFLFGEEIFIGETARNLDLNVLYVPDIIVRHYEHSSIGNFITKRINKLYQQSIADMIKYYDQSRV